jgi:hypothetical protein
MVLSKKYFKRYKKVRKNLRKKTKDKDYIEVESEANSIADELRKMIEPLIIRRSRRDLEQIDDYKKDLEIQEVSFSKVRDPELLVYDLGEHSKMYVETLEKIAHIEDEDSDIYSSNRAIVKFSDNEDECINH